MTINCYDRSLCMSPNRDCDKGRCYSFMHCSALWSFIISITVVIKIIEEEDINFWVWGQWFSVCLCVLMYIWYALLLLRYGIYMCVYVYTLRYHTYISVYTYTHIYTRTHTYIIRICVCAEYLSNIWAYNIFSISNHVKEVRKLFMCGPGSHRSLLSHLLQE